MSVSPFDYLTSINTSKRDIMVDDLTEKAYSAFMVNRGLSYFADTVLIANEMNRYHTLDKKLQYSFLINIVRKRKRFSKWNKPELVKDVDVVKEYYGYSNEKARQVLSLLSSDQMNNLREKVFKGGRRKQ
jgi:hypothetical protein|tara:strand:+ start:495 stop:884 length:390 start_codon:yes stop_codon:yes gene_type:complete